MKKLEAIAATLFGFAFLGLAAAVTVETIMRKAFNRSLQGVDELGGYILAIAGALSFAVALVARAHIRIDLIHDRLPAPLRMVLNMLASLTILACAAALLRMAWFAYDESVLFGATAQTPWATPLEYPQALWVGALALFFLVCVIEVIQILTLLARGRLTAIDRSYGPRSAREELEEELQDAKARGLGSGDLIGEGRLP
jgi:TRAP-type C4-dicarboxylate transport system permease small subunit